ncbi:MAG TPA: PEGA domain-containing protein [Candidatus Dormibacteraeota bacterium]|nr:PEGA domain-containing protein [Candidatus Dormibacteraeota bacterium]
MVKKLIALVLCLPLSGLPLFAYGQGNTFDKVRYNGGSVQTSVKPDEWGNKLTVTADEINLVLKDGQKIAIPPSQVTSISYGQEAHRNVGTAIGLAVFSLGIGALSALHKTKLHYIGINYNDKDGKKQGLLLQGDKNNFRAIIVALQGVTGLPVSVGDKDRNEIPAGINTQVARADEPKDEKAAAKRGSEAASPNDASKETEAVTVSAAEAIIALVSTPVGADVNVDDAFVGSAPASLKLKPGKHTIKVTMAGYKDWSREMTVLAGSQVNLTATLEKSN